MLTRYCTKYKLTPTRISLKISIVQDVKNRREWSLEQHVQHKGHRIDYHHQAGVDDCLHAKKTNALCHSGAPWLDPQIPQTHQQAVGHVHTVIQAQQHPARDQRMHQQHTVGQLAERTPVRRQQQPTEASAVLRHRSQHHPEQDHRPDGVRGGGQTGSQPLAEFADKQLLESETDQQADTGEPA